MCVPVGGVVPDSSPPDLRQLYDRLSRLGGSLRRGHHTISGRQCAWHLAALPLLVAGEAVGALLVAGPVEEAWLCSTQMASALGEGVSAGAVWESRRMSVLAEAAFGLAQEVFGSSLAREYAHQVCALSSAVASAPDAASAVRGCAEGLEALLQLADPRLPSLKATLGLLNARAGGATGGTAGGANTGSNWSLASTHAKASVTGSCASTGSCTVGGSNASLGSGGAIGAVGWPQLQLFCTPAGTPPVMLQAHETLLRTPPRPEPGVGDAQRSLTGSEDSSSAALGRLDGPEALSARRRPARPASSLPPSLALSPHQQGHQQRPQRLLAVRCPEEDLAPQQQRADLAALDAAGARATRGSLVMVSCPMPNALCAVVVYVCVAAPTGAATADAERTAECALGDAAAGGGSGRAGDAGNGAPASVAGGPGERTASGVALSEQQLKFVLGVVSSALEVVASCLEQRLASRRATPVAAPPRQAGRGPLELEPSPPDRSGLLTPSEACTDDVETGFWGSASALDLSSESTLLAQGEPASVTVSTYSVSRATALRFMQQCASTPSRARPSNLSAVSCASVGAGSAGAAPPDSDACSALMTTAHSELLSGCLSGEGPGAALEAGPITAAAEHSAGDECEGGGGVADRVDCTQAQELRAFAGKGGGRANLVGLTNVACSTRDGAGIQTDGFSAVCAAMEEAATSSWGVTPTGCDAVWPTSEGKIGYLGSGDDGRNSRGSCGGGGSSAAVGTGTAGMMKAPSLLLPRNIDAVPGAPLRREPGQAAGGGGVRDGACRPAASSCAGHPAVGGASASPSAKAGQSIMRSNQYASWPEFASACRGRNAGSNGKKHNSAGATVRLLASAFQRPASGGCASEHANSGCSAPGSRPRAQDCLDQASACDVRLVSSHEDSGSCAGSAAPPRVRPVKVLSLGKAAQQLQRAPPPPPPAPCSGTAASSPVACPAPPVYQSYHSSKQHQHLQLEQQQNLQQQAEPRQQPQGSAGGAACSPLGAWDFGPALQPAAQPCASRVAGQVAPMYGHYQPRRLNRMYLPCSAGATAAAAPSAAPGVMAAVEDATAARLPAASPVVSVTVGAAGSQCAMPPGTGTGALTGVAAGAAAGSTRDTVPLNVAVGDTGGAAMALSAAASAARDAALSPWSALASAAARSGAAPHPSLPPDLMPAAPQSRWARQPAPGEAATSSAWPALPAPVTPLAVAMPSVLTSPPSGQGARPLGGVAAPQRPTFAALAAAASAAAVSTPASGSSRKAPSRQLSDFVIPEDEPLESTVSETVAMMRMLSQARGAHLSARLRRVRVTAKIQSAHPETLPADLPSRLAGSLGLLGSPGADGARPGSTWVLTGVAARRGCIELVFDMVEVEVEGEPPLPLAAQSGPRQHSALLANPQTSGSSPTYRCWRSTEAYAPAAVASSLTSIIAGGVGAEPGTHAAGGSAAAAVRSDDKASLCGACGGGSPALAAGEEAQWVWGTCGLQPGTVGSVLQQCGLLSPASDPWVEVQVGHAPGGAVTLVWDSDRGQWTAARPPPAVEGSSSSPGPQPPSGMRLTDAAPRLAGPPGACEVAESPLEAPTLWLPEPVVVLPDGSSELAGVRVASWGPPRSERDTDEMLVRTSASYLPCRSGAAAATAVDATATAGRGGASRPPIVGDCVWHELAVSALSVALRRSGGLLLMECRRSRAASGPCPGAGGAPAPSAVTSAPLPLLVLPPRYAAAGGELRELSSRLARLMLGSESALGARPPAAGDWAAGEAAAQVEMACQQFLLDLGTLLDAVDAAEGAAGAARARPGLAAAAAAPDAYLDIAPGVSTPRGGDGCGDGDGEGPVRVGFEEGMRALLHGTYGGAPGASGGLYHQHLLDVACTLLAGCVAAGLLHTAALVLRLACALPLALAAPAALLAGAGADPSVAADLLATCRPSGAPAAAAEAVTEPPAAGAQAGVALEGLPLCVAAATGTTAPELACEGLAAGPGQDPLMAPDAASLQGGGGPEWGTTTDIHVGPSGGTHSLSRNLPSPLAVGRLCSVASGVLQLQLDASETGTGAVAVSLPLPTAPQSSAAAAAEDGGVPHGWRAGHVVPPRGARSTAGACASAVASSALHKHMRDVSADVDAAAGPSVVPLPAWQCTASAVQQNPGHNPADEASAVSGDGLEPASARPSGESGRGISGAKGCGAPAPPSQHLPDAVPAFAPDATGLDADAPFPEAASAGDADGCPGAAHSEGAVVAAAAAAAVPVEPARGARGDGQAWWALRYGDARLEAGYWRFVSERTSGMIWTYFLCVSFISVVSCARAWWEDGLPGFVSLLFFAGGQALLMGWYCLGRGARDPRAMVAAAMACKVLRAAADLLMGSGILAVPSLMEPMAVRGVEVFAEAVMRPIAERVPFQLFCLMCVVEMPCVWLLYRHFYTIYPAFWMRDWPLLRTLTFDLMSLLVHVAAELYWRREFRLWRRRVGDGGGPAASDASVGRRGSGDADAGARPPACKAKEE